MIDVPANYTGRFITLDGSEGVGKSTQLTLIAQWLSAQDIAFIQTREPGGTALGEQLRALMLNTQTNADEMAELLIMLAARRQHLVEKIWPALARGQWVICDRFNDSTYAYQGFGRGIDSKIIARLEQAMMGDFHPDKRFIFQADIATTTARLNKRAGAQDRFEQEQRDFFTRIDNGFAARLQAKNAIAIDATQSIEQVFAQIRQHLETLL